MQIDLKKGDGKKSCLFFVVMVRLRYVPIEFDLKLKVHQLLRNIWNYNIHSDKEKCVDCLIFEEWAVDFLKKKWKPQYVDIDVAIRKIKENDKTFIDFNEISIFDSKKVYQILKQK